MGKLIALAAHWIGRQMINLLIILFVLVIGVKLVAEVREYVGLLSQASELERGRERLPAFQEKLEKSAVERLEDIKAQSDGTVKAEIATIDQKIRTLEDKRRSDLERKLALIKGDFWPDIELDLKINMLQQEKQYLDKALVAINSAKQLPQVQAELAKLQIERASVSKQLQLNQNSQQQIKQNDRWTYKIPGTRSYRALRGLDNIHDQLSVQLNQIGVSIQNQNRRAAELDRLRNLAAFQPARDQYENTRGQLEEAIGQNARNLSSSIVGSFMRPVMPVLPTALLILLG